jgi:hypothetical protein
MKSLILIALLSILCASAPPFLEYVKEANGETIQIGMPNKYDGLALENVPISQDDNVILTNHTRVRHGYFLGRPVRRIFGGKLGEYFQAFVGGIIGHFPPLLHWAVVVTDELPQTKLDDPTLDIGKDLLRPDTGLVIELRHDAKTDIVSLNLKNWTTYSWHPKKAMYLGSVNKTDTELITVGCIYIHEIIHGKFHGFRRNCQHFTSWYIQAIWPKAPVPGPRVDQLLGKMLWWPVNWGKTRRWMWAKVRGRFLSRHGEEDVEELDSDTKSMTVEDLLATHPMSVRENATYLAEE